MLEVLPTKSLIATGLYLSTQSSADLSSAPEFENTNKEQDEHKENQEPNSFLSITKKLEHLDSKMSGDMISNMKKTTPTEHQEYL